MSNLARFPDRSTIEAEACAWIAQLDGDQRPTAEDLAALREWAKRSSLHYAELVRLSELFGELNVLTELAIPLEDVEKRPGLNRSSRIFASIATPRRAGALATMLVAAIATAFVFFGSAERQASVDLVYSTMIGQQREVLLSDGSTIELNTDTQVEVDFDRERRKIRLLRGEVHFSVTKDPARPFVVYAGTGMVRAVGTAFTVQLDDSKVDVTVTEGTVELASVKNVDLRDGSNELTDTMTAEPLAILNAGQSAKFDGESEVVETIDQTTMARKLSWRDGMLVFSGESLGVVVAEVSRYTALDIRFADSALQEIPIGGYFKVGETEALFDVLESGFGVKVVRVSDSVVELTHSNH